MATIGYMRNTDFDRLIAEVARRQHGVFHTHQARSVGATGSVLRNRASNGAIIRLAPSVWAVAGAPASWRRQYKAAELSVAGSAVADRAAALVHGLDGSRVVRPTVVVDAEVHRRQRLTDVRRSTDIAVTTVDGIRVTTEAQTLFDLLRCCDVPQVERAMDGALIRRTVEVEDLRERLDAMSALGRRHVSVWRALVEDRSAGSWGHAESELEVALHRLLRRLPPGLEVCFQATPPWWVGTGRRVDALVPEWGLIVEADGRRWHARVADFDRDRWRDNVAAANGHRVMRFTHAHLTERLDEALALLVAAGRAAAANRLPSLAAG